MIHQYQTILFEVDVELGLRDQLASSFVVRRDVVLIQQQPQRIRDVVSYVLNLPPSRQKSWSMVIILESDPTVAASGAYQLEECSNRANGQDRRYAGDAHSVPSAPVGSCACALRERLRAVVAEQQEMRQRGPHEQVVVGGEIVQRQERQRHYAGDEEGFPTQVWP